MSREIRTIDLLYLYKQYLKRGEISANPLLEMFRRRKILKKVEEINNKIENQQQLTEQDINDLSKNEYITKIIGKLYKKLCLKTHPDKDKSNIYKTKFEQVSNAYNNNDFLKLLLLSNELQINTDNIYNEEIELDNEETIKDKTTDTDTDYTLLFEKSINSINEKIKTIKSTLAWNWALSNPEQKQQLRERFSF
jgi:hypothetical protein